MRFAPPGTRRGARLRCRASGGPLSSALSSPLFLPAGLLASGCVGVLAPGIGQAAAALPASRLAPTVGIFLISGLSTRGRETSSLARDWRALALAAALTLLATPALGAAICRGCCGLLPGPAGWDLILGYAVMVCAPTTLSSCVGLASQLSARAGAAALLLTVSTNAAAVVTMPLLVGALVPWLSGAHGGAAAAGAAACRIDAAPMVAELARTVMLPFALGCAVRRLIPAAARAVDANRPAASAASNLLLILVPWMQVSKGHATMRGAGAGTLLAAAAIGAAVHAAFFGLSLAASEGTRVSDDASVRRAVAIVGGQKTLPVSVAVLQQLEHLAASVPVAMLPLLIAHFIQIVIDSFVVAAWRRGGD